MPRNHMDYRAALILEDALATWLWSPCVGVNASKKSSFLGVGEKRILFFSLHIDAVPWRYSWLLALKLVCSSFHWAEERTCIRSLSLRDNPLGQSGLRSILRLLCGKEATLCQALSRLLSTALQKSNKTAKTQEKGNHREANKNR